LPVIIPAMFDIYFKHEFWTILELGPLLKQGLCPKGTWRVAALNAVTPPEPARALARRPFQRQKDDQLVT